MEPATARDYALEKLKRAVEAFKKSRIGGKDAAEFHTAFQRARDAFVGGNYEEAANQSDMILFLFEEAGPTSITTPELEVPPELPPATVLRKKKSLAILVAVGLLVSVGVATMILLQPGASPATTTASESRYLTDLGGMLQQASNVLNRYSATLNDLVGGFITEAEALVQLYDERNDMRVLRDAARTMSTPCSTYNSMHMSVTSALANFYDAIRTTILAIELADPAYLDLSLAYMNAGNADVQVANSKMDALAPTVPNC